MQIAVLGLEEFHKSNKEVDEVRSVMKGVVGKGAWKKPCSSVVKAKWDASLDQQNGLGIIFRNDKGEVMVVACGRRDNVTQPALANCMALWRAMELGQELGFKG